MQAVQTGRIRIVPALLGEHGAIYPLLALMENSAPTSSLDAIKVQTEFLRATLLTHASIEDAVLRPSIEQHLTKPAPNADGTPGLTDHQIIEEGLSSVLAAATAEDARALLLETIAKTRTHFAKEERVVFALAERELSEQAQERLGVEWATRRAVFLA